MFSYIYKITQYPEYTALKNRRFINTKIALLFVLLCFLNFSANAQNSPQKETNNFWQNVRFGGGIGLSFGDGFFSGTLAPSAIYQFNESFAVGLGLNGTYNKREDFYSSTILGASILTLFNPIRDIQLSTEIEQLHVNRNFDQNFIEVNDDKYWYTALFLGAGYRTGNVTLGIRYDVLYDKDKSIYADPWIPFVRVFF